MKQLLLRPATADDREFALLAHHGAYHDLVVRQFGTWDLRLQDEFFERSWSIDTHNMITVAGAAVGYCCIEHRPDDIHLREFVVHPDHQGRGVGSAVLEHIKAEARKRSVPIRLGAFHLNRAVELYRRCGFAEFDRTPTHTLMEWRPDST